MMGESQMLSYVALSLAAVAVSGCLMSLMLVRRVRAEMRQTLAVVVALEGDLEATSRDIDSATQRANEQARRIAWLETRVRGRASAKDEDELAPVARIEDKTNLTERRHRVLALARRGLDAAAVADSLGMPHGEVELIINLSRAA